MHIIFLQGGSELQHKLCSTISQLFFFFLNNVTLVEITLAIIIILDIKGLILSQRRAHELLPCAAGKNKQARNVEK